MYIWTRNVEGTLEFISEEEKQCNYKKILIKSSYIYIMYGWVEDVYLAPTVDFEPSELYFNHGGAS